MTDERWARARRAYAVASQPAREADAALRVGDAERQAVVAELQGHYVAGRLDSDELSDRLGQALAARTVSQLRVPMRNLPARQATMHAPQAQARWASMPSLMLAALLALMLLSWLFWLPGMRF
jgi:hypothetical protein